MKRYPKKKLLKYYAEQMLLQPVVSESEPHSIPRCVACDNPKIEFHRNGDGQLYYKCSCGFESEELGPAPAYLKD